MGLVCRVFTGRPLNCRKEAIGALNTADLRRLPSPADTTAAFAERIETLEDLELLLDFDPRLDLKLRIDVGLTGFAISFGIFGLDCDAFSLIGGCADKIDAHD